MVLSLLSALAVKSPEHIRIVDQFYPRAVHLRSAFDRNFRDPRQAHAMRFVWDYWHIPGQYTLHRTMAADYFEQEEFDALTSALTEFGQQELGCRAITPPWLSFYVDGCEQQLHADVPQGPFAYVLSLTNWDGRSFRGGETQIMQPSVLDYWRAFDSSQGLELTDLLLDVPPLFNRLTIFDARIPHGVRRVDGVHDPREARLVLHGWFCENEPYVSGDMDEETVSEGLTAPLRRISEILAPPFVIGLLSVRMDIIEDGSVAALFVLADTMVADPSQTGRTTEDARAFVHRTVKRELKSASFTPQTQPCSIYIPFVFD